ncbi:hypothetical protein HPP92_021016 [Vanilla planifolia]|uniref:Uncharacterized protein n=1 Tax=Vanilla planifolia TaxID=51239 RepID=A0A835Q1J4_VANPL|nr:hypothetical protein HPP92_021016 [Vanilla planifolia]
MWIPASLAYSPPRSSEAPPVANLHQHEGVEGVMRGFKRCDRADLKQTVGVPAGDRSFSAGVGKREARNSKGSGWEVMKTVLDLEHNGLTRFTMKPNIKTIELPLLDIEFLHLLLLSKMGVPKHTSIQL